MCVCVVKDLKRLEVADAKFKQELEHQTRAMAASVAAPPSHRRRNPNSGDRLQKLLAAVEADSKKRWAELQRIQAEREATEARATTNQQRHQQQQQQPPEAAEEQSSSSSSQRHERDKEE